MNVVVVRGILSSEPVERVLASGAVLVTLEVTTPLPDATRATVPVAWFDPPAGVRPVAGDEVVVSGTVRRRFYRAAEGTRSRTEIVAETVVSATRRRTVDKVLRAAAAAMD